MPKAKTLDLGDTYTVDWVLKNSSGAPLTGAVITGTVREPDGTSQVAAISTVIAGTYRATFQPTKKGFHRLKLQLTSPGVAVDFHRFLVVAPKAFS